MNEITKDKNSKVLGRGFASLLQTTPSSAAQAPATATGDSASTRQILLVATEKIRANTQQPRRRFNAEALQDLTQSIRDKGVLQPLIVQSVPGSSDTYELIAGERRLRAATLAGLRQVPVIVRQSSNEDSLEVALIENIQREDLNPIEEANGYRELIERYGMNQEEVAKRVGKSRSAVANGLRLLKLPKKVVEYLVEGKLTAGQVRPLIGIENGQEAEAMAERILQQGLSARVVETSSAPLKKKKAAVAPAATSVNVNLTAVQDSLRRLFGTKVAIKAKDGKGQIEIHFYSTDELGRIVKLLGI